jgi:hypothetical protein
MSLTYKIYLSSLNTEVLNKDDDWGQHYDMESQILINALKPLAHPILAHPILAHPILAHPKLEPERDLESGLNKKLQNYATKQPNNSKYKCTFITSLIYIAHLVLFVMLFK